IIVSANRSRSADSILRQVLFYFILPFHFCIYMLQEALLSGDACYIKYGTPHFMDLNVEIIDDNRYAMSHNYVLNGDLMADPDVEFTVDKDNRLLYPESYQQDNLQFYQRVDKDPVAAHQLNEFMDEWLNNIQENQYKVKAVYTEEQVIENANDIRRFCKENNLANMAPKVKEKER
ncbi:DUF6908 domain-containing protein, partial [Bulleidia sp. HCP3S3_F2]|uniref:DUF6908 domain-containing protein n=2 Tax=Bulleidia TaxID=118747 RepID=UPI003F8BC972